ncbi:MAG: HD domain-containing protein [Planctomycetota bacterium]
MTNKQPPQLDTPVEVELRPIVPSATLTDDPRLAAQLDFLQRVGHLTQVLRRSRVADGRGGDRRENAAEHSWQAGLAVLLLAEHADEPIDAAHAAVLMLVHDVVEVEAGDTFIFDATASATIEQREAAALERLVEGLPSDQADWLRDLQAEYVAQLTPESRFGKAVDRLLPQLLHLQRKGKPWITHGITREQTDAVWRTIATGSTTLAEVSRAIQEAAIAEGWIADPPDHGRASPTVPHAPAVRARAHN